MADADVGVAAPAGAAANPPEPEPVRLMEVIDKTHVPTETEVFEAAEWLGIDVDCDADLLWIAKDFLSAPMPNPWAPYEGRTPEEIFYFNPQTGESTWHHPCDEVYRQLYQKEKVKKAPLKIVSLSFATFADDCIVKVTCTGVSGDPLATLFGEQTQNFGGLKAMLAEELQLDASRLRLILSNAVLPRDDDVLASFI